MLDKEQYPHYDTRPEYGEGPDYEQLSPTYGQMAHAPLGEKVTPPKRSWTRTEIISAVVLVLVVVGGIFLIMQNIAIEQRQYDVQGKVGNVWNEVDRASQLLQQDAALLNSTIASQNDAITKIAQARSNAGAIKASQGTADTNAALAAATQMTGGIRVFAENYPDYGVGSNAHSVLVQIEAFLWHGTMRPFPFFWMTGTDRFSGGHGTMRIKLLSMIPLPLASGPKMDQGELQRYLGEIIWFPTAWFSDAIEWHAIDEHSVQATLHEPGVAGSVAMHVNEKGQLTLVTAQRYLGKEGILTPWSIQLAGYREAGGMRIPTAFEVTWHLASGDFTWFRGQLTEIEYNQSGKVIRFEEAG